MSYPQNRTKSLESEGQKNSPQVLYNPGNDNHTVRCLFWGKFDSEKKKTVENWSFHMLCSSRLWECNVFHPALVLHIKSEKSIVCKCYYNFVNFWMVKDTWLIAHHWFYLNYLTLLWSPSFYVYLNRLFIDYRSLTASSSCQPVVGELKGIRDLTFGSTVQNISGPGPTNRRIRCPFKYL